MTCTHVQRMDWSSRSAEDKKEEERERVRERERESKREGERDHSIYYSCTCKTFVCSK